MSDIFDWSATAGNNTTVDGIGINTGMNPGNVDNALRSVMALIRNTFVSGWQGLFAGTASGIPVSNGAGTITAIAAPSGAIVGTTDTQTLTNKTISGGTISGSTITGIADIAIADGGTGASTAAAAFANIAVTASSLASPGYIQFVNGLILQWGFASVTQDASVAVTYPIAFASFSVPIVSGVTRVGVSESQNTGITSGSATPTGFTLYNAQDATLSVPWFAVGI